MMNVVIVEREINGWNATSVATFYFILGIMLINIQGEDFSKKLKIYIKPYLHYKFLTQKMRIKQIMII